ncbi:MAG: type II toxin-antitoxin system VapC family toxin [Synechococcales cyanobacterium RU_4_20]|nr:type II toxin-antitoxin system VapC family toxin [Synechococcales cyanobacterium RU_4_20]NJR67837.1 type II toxin-antitoxin system VapC family toxin [Synechococcales cyanobacterium CRU_2_2]
MASYVLDSDHISLFLGNHPQVCERFAKEWADSAITIISVQEIFNGWASRLSRSGSELETVRVYEKWHVVTEFFKLIEILNYDAAASRVYEALIQGNPELGKRRLEKDMRIAAIALSQDITVVTRNQRDFEPVPGLALENWTV